MFIKCVNLYENIVFTLLSTSSFYFDERHYQTYQMVDCQNIYNQ